MAGTGRLPGAHGQRGTVPAPAASWPRDWLARLQGVAAMHDVVLTAYADPDVNAVARAGLKLSTALDPQVQARISPYPERRPVLRPADLAGRRGADQPRRWTPWSAAARPPCCSATPRCRARTSADPKPDALSPLPSAAGKAVALVTDSPIEATVRERIRRSARSQPTTSRRCWRSWRSGPTQAPDHRPLRGDRAGPLRRRRSGRGRGHDRDAVTRPPAGARRSRSAGAGTPSRRWTAARCRPPPRTRAAEISPQPAGAAEPASSSRSPR